MLSEQPGPFFPKSFGGRDAWLSSGTLTDTVRAGDGGPQAHLRPEPRSETSPRAGRWSPGVGGRGLGERCRAGGWRVGHPEWGTFWIRQWRWSLPMVTVPEVSSPQQTPRCRRIRAAGRGPSWAPALDAAGLLNFRFEELLLAAPRALCLPGPVTLDYPPVPGKPPAQAGTGGPAPGHSRSAPGQVRGDGAQMAAPPPARGHSPARRGSAQGNPPQTPPRAVPKRGTPGPRLQTSAHDSPTAGWAPRPVCPLKALSVPATRSPSCGRLPVPVVGQRGDRKPRAPRGERDRGPRGCVRTRGLEAGEATPAPQTGPSARAWPRPSRLPPPLPPGEGDAGPARQGRGLRTAAQSGPAH